MRSNLERKRLRNAPTAGIVGGTAAWALSLSPAEAAWLRFKQNRAACIGGLFLLLTVSFVILWPVFRAPGIANWLPPSVTYAPTALSNLQFAAPAAGHWFGTDVHGRDLLSRVVYGARISLLVGLVGAGVSLVIGVLWGAVAGYVGGRCDQIMMRAVDVLYSLPSIVFVIVMITTLEELFKGWLAKVFSPEFAAMGRMLFLFAGLGSVSWLTMARIVRGQVLSLRNQNFVLASLALGASHRRIIFRHILPNVGGVVIVYLTLTVPSIVLYESFLSYLGLGIQPPQASLGSLIAEGASQINPIRIYWWLIAFPGGFLAALLLALNFLGDGLRDALDPRAAERR
ncbi:MAG: ABC transporter permease [Verrucomicrobia bacterium]|nr:ABC transporter permease [Verrucomicrobiota bacterium]